MLIALDFPIMFDVDIAFNPNIVSNIKIAVYMDIAKNYQYRN